MKTGMSDKCPRSVVSELQNYRGDCVFHNEMCQLEALRVNYKSASAGGQRQSLLQITVDMFLSISFSHGIYTKIAFTDYSWRQYYKLSLKFNSLFWNMVVFYKGSIVINKLLNSIISGSSFGSSKQSIMALKPTNLEGGVGRQFYPLRFPWSGQNAYS